MSERIANLQTAIETMCTNARLATHPKAKRCYTWSYVEHGEPQYVTVLEIPPVDSAETAVKIAISAEAKKKK
jgi:hypothetical protein